jgi:hypothetical protein
MKNTESKNVDNIIFLKCTQCFLVIEEENKSERAKAIYIKTETEEISMMANRNACQHEKF